MITVTVPAPIVNKRPKMKGKLKKGPDGKLAPTTPRAAFLNANQRINHNEKSKITKMWREAGCEAAEAAGLPVLKDGRFFLMAYIHLPRKVSYDGANYYSSVKPIVDGIVSDYGFLPDDSNQYIVGPLHIEGEADPGKGSIRLEFYDVRDNADRVLMLEKIGAVMDDAYLTTKE